MSGDAAITYANEFRPAKPEEIAHWKVIPVQGSLPSLIGNCPTCHHECDIPVVDVVVSGSTTAAAIGQPIAELTRQLICNCRIDHQQPAGVAGGCGRYWLGTLTLQGDGTYQLAPESDLRLLPAATGLNEAVANQDNRIQSTAEKWLGAVTAIYGLFSLAGIATGKDALAGMTTWPRLLVAFFFFAGLIVAAFALISGYRAAYGWPRIASVKDNQELATWYAEYRNYAQKAALNLKTAVALAFISLGAIFGVTMLVWFLPRSGT